VLDETLLVNKTRMAMERTNAERSALGQPVLEKTMTKRSVILNIQTKYLKISRTALPRDKLILSKIIILLKILRILNQKKLLL
jgi:hypothetical protein